MKLLSLTSLSPLQNPQHTKKQHLQKIRTRLKKSKFKNYGKLEVLGIINEHFSRLNQDNYCQIMFSLSI